MPQKPFLEAGQITGTHGVRGEVRIQPWCDSAEQFAGFRTLYWDAAGTRPVRLHARPHKQMALARLEGIDTVEAAAALRGPLATQQRRGGARRSALRGRMLFVARRDLRLPEGYHLVQDLIGLTVVDADTGETYGRLTDVSQTGANAVYHMQTPRGEVLIPAIPQVVIAIDTAADILRLRPMKGLLDDEI